MRTSHNLLTANLTSPLFRTALLRPIVMLSHDVLAYQYYQWTSCIFSGKAPSIISTLTAIDNIDFCRVTSLPKTGNRINKFLSSISVRFIVRQNRLYTEALPPHLRSPPKNKIFLCMATVILRKLNLRTFFNGHHYSVQAASTMPRYNTDIR